MGVAHTGSYSLVGGAHTGAPFSGTHPLVGVAHTGSYSLGWSTHGCTSSGTHPLVGVAHTGSYSLGGGAHTGAPVVGHTHWWVWRTQVVTHW